MYMRKGIWVLLFPLVLMVTGCQMKNASPSQQSSPSPLQKISHEQRVKQTAPEPKYNKSPQAVANRLVVLAKRVPHVKGATAISTGPYTLVGIDVDKNLDRSRVETIKYTVAQALREDPQGSNALVTADADLVQRIRELNEAIQEGRPLSGLMEELADIAARIMPQPSKETPKKEKAPSKNEQKKYMD